MLDATPSLGHLPESTVPSGDNRAILYCSFRLLLASVSLLFTLPADILHTAPAPPEYYSKRTNRVSKRTNRVFKRTNRAQ